MKKIFTLRANEDWIIDHMVDDWENFLRSENRNLIPVYEHEPNSIVWILADFCWKQLPVQVLNDKSIKKIITIHHIVPGKFGVNEQNEFRYRDQFIDFYHVFNDRTRQFLTDICNISPDRIVFIPYWYNNGFWKPDKNLDIEKTRASVGLSKNDFVVFSAQRDTEGHDLISPKKEKGPDLLADAIIELKKQHPNLKVLLGGWRRQYIMNRLTEAKIEFNFLKSMSKNFVPLNEIREAYQISDLYVVASRCEGGPQALLECGGMGLKTISRPVGIAEQVLPPSAINSDVWMAEPAIPNVSNMTMAKIFPQYANFFESLPT